MALNLEDGSTGLTTLSLSKGLAGPPLYGRRSLKRAWPGAQNDARPHDSYRVNLDIRKGQGRFERGRP